MSQDNGDTTLSLAIGDLRVNLDHDVLAVNHQDAVEDASQNVVSMEMTHRNALPMLPLELQESIIASGPQAQPHRVEFLCKCALVCKDWVVRARSLLKLSQKSSSRWNTLVSLTQDPLTTLKYAMEAVYVNDHGPQSIHTLQVLHCHISRLSLHMVNTRILVPYMATMASVQVLKLKEIRFETSYEEFSALMAFFPALHTLRLSQIIWPPHELVEFDITGPYTSLHALTITTSQSDIDVLDLLLAASPFLQRLTLQLNLSSNKTGPVSEWIPQASFCQTESAALHLAFKFSDMFLYWFEDHDGMDAILGCTQSIIIPSPEEGDLTETLPRWIAEAPHLDDLEVSAADRNYSLGDDPSFFAALSSSLAGAKKNITVRFTKWWDYRRLEEYLEVLRVLVHPNVMVLVQMDPSSNELTRIY